MSFVRIALMTVLITCMTIVAAVSLHSVKEIHYLKSFYPAHFTVSDAAAAALVELIKVTLVAFPLFLMAMACLFLLWLSHKTGNEERKPKEPMPR